MKIWEIEPRSNIILKITVNGQYIDLPTVAHKQDADGIICEAIRLNGKVISINNANISLELMYIRKNLSPVVWKGVLCDSITLESKMYYKLTSKDEGAEKNRREAFRLFVGCKGVAQIGTNRKAVYVTVKDVSETGFAFVGDTSINSVEGTPVRLVFADMDEQLSLMGIVVRKVPIDDKSSLYGCRLSVANSKLTRYILNKQRTDISRNKEDNSDVVKGVAVVKNDTVEKSGEKPRERKRIMADTGIDPELYNELKKHYRNKDEQSALKRSIDAVDRSERREAFKRPKSNNDEKRH
jgi:hypothetical protein